MSVEREVVGDERGGREERLEPAAQAGVDDEGSLRQKRPWWTSTSSAPSSAACSNSSREHDTPHAIVVTSAAPTTWSPCGANSG